MPANIPGSLGHGAMEPTCRLLVLALAAACSDATITGKTATNEAPTVEIASPSASSSFPACAVVTVTATFGDLESAPDELTLVWTVDGVANDGATETRVGNTAALAVSELVAGDHEVGLAVVDPEGASASAAVAFTVETNSAPTVAFLSPDTDQVFTVDDAILVVLDVADVEDQAALDTIGLAWTLDGSPTDLLPAAPETTGRASGELDGNELGIGEHVLAATATDSCGLVGEAEVAFVVEDCASTWYADDDGDGFGDPTAAAEACDPPSGTVADASDCDDGDAAVHPEATETCNGLDDDCDTLVDEPGAEGEAAWYADHDGDGYGNAADSTAACSAPDGAVADLSDCDDGDPAVNPAAVELCNGFDDDCDSLVDESDATDATAWYRDADGDGYGDTAVVATSCSAPAGYVGDATDCDDRAASVHPYASEVCDGTDQDCDGVVDDGLTSTWYADADGDGFGDPAAATSACSAPSGYVADDSDCDDTDARVNPGASEVCDEADIDEDCDGLADDADPSLDASGPTTWYADADADGHGDQDDPGTRACDGPPGAVSDTSDCDDADPTIWEGCLSGTYELANADAKLVGADADDQAGTSVASPGDVDGDGYGEVLVGAPNAGSDGQGAVYLVRGPVAGDVDLARADAIWTGTTPGEAAGSSVASAGDVDGDGSIDLIIGAQRNPGGGAAYLLTSLPSGTASLAGATAIVESTDGGYFGHAVAGVGDGDADGYDEFAVADIYGGSEAGAVYLFDGPLTGSASTADAVATLTGENREALAGWSVASGGDVNGDGVPDMLVGAPGDNAAGTGTGAAYLVLGPVTGTASLSSADAKLVAEAAGDAAGSSVDLRGDVDNDGHADLLIGAPASDVGHVAAGSVYLVLGPVSGTFYLRNADAILTGTGEGANSGISVAVAGHVDGDTSDDLLIGASGESTNGANAGAAYLLHGTVRGTLGLDLADAVFLGEGTRNGAGMAVVGGEDLDADGHDDLLIAAPQEGSGGTEAGAVYVVTSR